MVVLLQCYSHIVWYRYVNTSIARCCIATVSSYMGMHIRTYIHVYDIQFILSHVKMQSSYTCTIMQHIFTCFSAMSATLSCGSLY